MQSSPIQKTQISDKYQLVVKFDRGNSIYKPDEIVTGSISLQGKVSTNFKIDIPSLTFSVLGQLSIQNKHSIKIPQNLLQKIKPITIIKIDQQQLAKNKTITQDTKLPFRFKLDKSEHKYQQTYIGVYVSVSYTLFVRAKFSEGIIKQEIPFYIQVPKAGRQAIDNFVYPKKKNFMVRSEDIKGDQTKIPKFKIKGQLDSQIIFFNDDLYGNIVVDLADSPIRSVDLQMLRVETIQFNQDKFSDKTQIQMIQVCDGNVTRNLEIPVYMILPRFYSCPTIKYLWCSIEFQVNLQIIFKDGFKVTSNIPLKFIRS